MVYCCIGHHLNNDGALWCTVCGSLVEGAKVGDYRLLSYIGNGSAADVYLAGQPALNGRKVVIKVLHSQWSEARARDFEREVLALALLSHPYILPIFDHGVLSRAALDAQNAQGRGEEECLPYLVLPYAEQGSLAEILERHGNRPWSLTRVVTIAKEMAEALDYAHERGVLHRDVKPGNILQMGTHAVLSDFSVAALIEGEISHLNAHWAGSPGYMAPEVWQMRPGRYSDQYALAVTCYYLLAVQLPWQRGKGHTQTWAELHCFVEPRSIMEVRPGLPLAIDMVLKRALAKDPHDRYPTVQAFADDLYVASQDITQVIRSAPTKDEARSRKVITRPTLVGIPAREQEERKAARPVIAGAVDAPTAQIAVRTPEAARKLPVTPLPVTAMYGEKNDADTSMLRSAKNGDNWIWYALVLNLLACLMLVAEYAWQAGSAGVAADALLVVLPALLTGPLLALLFRRVSYGAPLWGLFWGVFFGLTDALASTLLCFVWGALIQLPSSFRCGTWCSPGDGFRLMFQLIAGLAAQALVPVVLGLWFAVIGGAIIGLVRLRSQ